MKIRFMIIFIILISGCLLTAQESVKKITMPLGSFDIPENFVLKESVSTDEKYFIVLVEDSEKDGFVNNVSVEKRRNRYAKDNHFAFREAIVRQLVYQCNGKYDIDGDGYKTKKGYIVYKFIICPGEELLKERPNEPNTIQYYIIFEDNSFVLVHETTRGDDAVTDEVAECIADSFEAK